MGNKKKYEPKKAIPTVAPGFDDEKFGEDATKQDIKEGKSTKVTRAYLDENDPSE